MDDIIIKTYNNELKTTVLNEDNSESEFYVKIRIGFKENRVSLNLLILSNSKMYLTNNSLLGVKYNEEINPIELYYKLSKISNNLKQIQKDINFITNINCNPRHISGFINWVVDNYNSDTSEFKDLDKVFIKDKKEFAYYSSTTKELIPLTKNAHRFILVRNIDNIVLSENIDKPIYILETCKLINNDVESTEEYGNEYVIEHSLGTIIYTPLGYIYNNY